MQIVSDGKRNASARSAFYSKISLKETLTLALLQPELWTIYGTQKRGDFVRKSVSSSRRSNESSKKKSTPTTLGYQNETFCETVLRLVSHREKFTMCSKRHIFFFVFIYWWKCLLPFKKRQNKVYVNAEQPYPRIVAKQGFT